VVAERTVVSPGRHTAVLEFSIRPARAKIVPAKLFAQLFFSMHRTLTTLNGCFGRKPLPALAHHLKSAADLRMDMKLT
jgi:hypothetical protein